VPRPCHSLLWKGLAKPEACKFPIEVPEIELTEVIEILDISDKAKKSIEKVKVWQA
jgi:hypothetical protein